VLRRATPDDAEGIACVHVRTWQGAYGHVFPPEKLAGISPEERARYWRTTLGRGSRTYVAEADGDVVGFASAGPSRDEDGEGIGELYAIYVDPDAWSTGAGRALIDQCEEQLSGDYGDATLWVLEDNPRARAFYERAGWLPDGARKAEERWGVRAPEVRYRKELKSSRS
jgi:ribosomal protein S18 acetylase RimI-like enzyme